VPPRCVDRSICAADEFAKTPRVNAGLGSSGAVRRRHRDIRATRTRRCYSSGARRRRSHPHGAVLNVPDNAPQRNAACTSPFRLVATMPAPDSVVAVPRVGVRNCPRSFYGAILTRGPFRWDTGLTAPDGFYDKGTYLHHCCITHAERVPGGPSEQRTTLPRVSAVPGRGLQLGSQEQVFRAWTDARPVHGHFVPASKSPNPLQHMRRSACPLTRRGMVLACGAGGACHVAAAVHRRSA
jgi:hypothetical protein